MNWRSSYIGILTFFRSILKLLNLRKLEEMKTTWWSKEAWNGKECEGDNEGDGEGGISIANIGGVFIVIFVGIALAVITLIFEYW